MIQTWGQTWLNQTWLNQTWLNQTWLNQTWLNQTWLNQMWLNQTWLNQTWLNQTWLNQTWLNQMWLNQTWLNQTWLNQTWLNQTRLNQTWLNQTWQLRPEFHHPWREINEFYIVTQNFAAVAVKWQIGASACRGALVVTAAAVLLAVVITWVLYVVGSAHTSEFLRLSLQGPIRYNHPELLRYIREQLLIPPSSLPYNLLGRRNKALQRILDSERFYHEATELIFKNVRRGVFVEAGALDGETMSNTLELEKNHGWTGLLVEVEKPSFDQLVNKHRKAWLANVCLSPHKYPTQELFAGKSSHISAATIEDSGFKHRAMSKLQRYRAGQPSLMRGIFRKVQCIPLCSLLAALNMTRVDLLVLDVEGAEMDILRNFDFDEFDIQAIYLEWKNFEEHRKISEEIKSKGYRLIKHGGEDFVFLKKASRYDNVLPDYDINLP
ncbi:uncharacterized protein LOC108672814 [Hyalella azteca]|uniref:Uncharacterized protein LOC108672814 n=1 Tax=Hyalella azteca TaxID=294128 RepID=A0A979FW75_HYAAZ|nr:uncharacterized protein LOC108672814 [Hyalella azteca]